MRRQGSGPRCRPGHDRSCVLSMIELGSGILHGINLGLHKPTTLWLYDTMVVLNTHVSVLIVNPVEFLVILSKIH